MRSRSFAFLLVLVIHVLRSETGQASCRDDIIQFAEGPGWTYPIGVAHPAQINAARDSGMIVAHSRSGGQQFAVSSLYTGELSFLDLARDGSFAHQISPDGRFLRNQNISRTRVESFDLRNLNFSNTFVGAAERARRTNSHGFISFETLYTSYGFQAFADGNDFIVTASTDSRGYTPKIEVTHAGNLVSDFLLPSGGTVQHLAVRGNQIAALYRELSSGESTPYVFKLDMNKSQLKSPLRLEEAHRSETNFGDFEIMAFGPVGVSHGKSIVVWHQTEGRVSKHVFFTDRGARIRFVSEDGKKMVVESEYTYVASDEDGVLELFERDDLLSSARRQDSEDFGRAFGFSSRDSQLSTRRSRLYLLEMDAAAVTFKEIDSVYPSEGFDIYETETGELLLASWSLFQAGEIELIRLESGKVHSRLRTWLSSLVKGRPNFTSGFHFQIAVFPERSQFVIYPVMEYSPLGSDGPQMIAEYNALSPEEKFLLNWFWVLPLNQDFE